tara:strand:+ start:1194 stop:2105 length:912 start_codon:yes stop_codon:yes gene_type:complete
MENNENPEKKQSKKDLFKALDKLRNVIVSLKKDLNKINNEKESWFSKKEEFSNKIKENIKIIKENKPKRDALTKKVKELKEQRNILNQDAKHKISEFKKLNDLKKILISKSKIKDPSAIKKEIDRTEVKLETEVMPFEHEKKLSKKLKDLKKSLEGASKIIEIIEEIKKQNPKINTLRKNTEKVHSEIQKTAKESQILHESVIKSSKDIDELKLKEKEAFKKFSKLKKRFVDINNQLKRELGEMSITSEKINKFRLEEKEKRELKDTMLIQVKEQEFKEKFKHGKKITTEDFLMFQDIIKDKK